MGLLSPAERERHAHVAFLDAPIPDLDTVDLDHWHEVAQPCSQHRIDARVARCVDVDFRPTDALVGAQLKQDLPGVMTQMTASACIEDHPWFHMASLGPWYMKCWETHSIGGFESRLDPGTVEE
jgi:hypothetical protein